MRTVWLRISDERGFSPVEALLAAAVFGMLVTGLIGAIIYGRQSTDEAGDRSRAVQLAEEATEAVRNIRDAGFTNLVDGTYGLVQSGNQWTLSGSSDTNGNFTRSITIATASTNSKTITSTVTWAQQVGSGVTQLTTRLTNWIANFVKTWTKPTQESNTDLTGNLAGVKVATQGDYVYIVRADGTADFMILDISNPALPVVRSTVNIAGAPTNIFVSGNYAYITTNTNSGELYIYNISNPAAPTLTGTYDAPGNSDGRGVYVVGAIAHLVRAANATNYEYVRINVAVPSNPTAVAWASNNIAMTEVYVNSTDVFITTESDTQEMLEITSTSNGPVTPSATVNLTGNTNATTIDGYNKILAIGQGTIFRIIDSTTATNTALGTLTLPGTINDIAYSSTHNIFFVATNTAAGELRIVNAANLSALTIYSSLDITGTVNLTGITYSATKDRAIGVGTATAQEMTVIAPGNP